MSDNVYQGLGEYRQRNGETVWIVADLRDLCEPCKINYPLIGSDGETRTDLGTVVYGDDGDLVEFLRPLPNQSQAVDVGAIRKVIRDMRSALHGVWADRLEAAFTEPDYKPLTEETLDGLYWWCDGEGGDWLPCAVLRNKGHCAIEVRRGNGTIALSLGMAQAYGYVRPLVPTPGPILPKPIQGQKPKPGILTKPDGSRYHAVAISGRAYWYEHYNVGVASHKLNRDGYKWEASEE